MEHEEREAKGHRLRWWMDAAIQDGNLSRVLRLLRWGVDIDGPTGDQDETPLMLAASHGQIEIARALLQRGAQINAPTEWGSSALSMACWHGGAEMIRLLIEAGADIECRHRDQGDTPLMWAASNGNLSAIEVLLEAGADIEARDDKGFTPLLAACYSGQRQAVALLLEHGADIHARSKCHTALALAALRGHAEAIRLLLERGVDVNEEAPNGWTALDFAITGAEYQLKPSVHRVDEVD